MVEHYNLISSYKWFYLFKLRESVKVDCAPLEYCYKDLLLDKTLSRIWLYELISFTGVAAALPNKYLKTVRTRNNTASNGRLKFKNYKIYEL